MLAKAINWVLCIAKNINVMAARMQFTRERQHVLTQATKLRLRDVFADQQDTHGRSFINSLQIPTCCTARRRRMRTQYSQRGKNRALKRVLEN